MNTNIQIFLLCPISENQKPINNYIGLKENSLTSWTTLSNKKYNRKLYFLFLSFFLTISFLRIYSFLGFYYFYDWFLENIFFASFCVLFLLSTILFRWLQIENTFQTARIFYEESSWYDGQTWEKPLILIKNDRLLSSQKIRPVRKRIQQTFFYTLYSTFTFTFFIFLLFFFLKL